MLPPLSLSLLPVYLRIPPRFPSSLTRHFSPPFLVRLFEFFFFFLLFFPLLLLPSARMFLRSRNRTTGEYQSVKLVSPRRARNFSEDRGWREGGVRRKEKFVAKFAAPIVIANIFIPSYSFRFSLSIFFLSSMRDDDGKNRSEFRR